MVSGQPAATIVIAVTPSDEILFAAQQLQRYVAKMSGAVLPVASEDDEVAGNRILLGVADLVAQAGVIVPEGLDEGRPTPRVEVASASVRLKGMNK